MHAIAKDKNKILYNIVNGLLSLPAFLVACMTKLSLQCSNMLKYCLKTYNSSKYYAMCNFDVKSEFSCKIQVSVRRDLDYLKFSTGVQVASVRFYYDDYQRSEKQSVVITFKKLA